MRIGLNATCYNDHPSGASQRFRGIYGALIRNHPEIQFLVYEPQDCRVARWFGDAPNIIVRVTPLPSVGRFAKVAHGFSYWPKALARDCLDLFECFDLPLVKSPGCATLLTIHDVRYARSDQPWLRRAAAGLVYQHALDRADAILTVSNTMRTTIEAMKPRGNVVTVFNGLDPVAFRTPHTSELHRVRARYQVPAQFALSVGHLEERKDYPTLIEAIAQLRDEGLALPLIIVGNEGGDRGRIEATIEKYSLASQVNILNHVSDETLRSLYYLSDVVVFPSKYEGFGLPILEAMAAQRPLVLSDIPVFREITEGEGLYFRSGDGAELAGKMREVIASSLVRKRLIRYGNERVRDFAFSGLADQIYAVYKAILVGGIEGKCVI